jgi:hypothetical protein
MAFLPAIAAVASVAGSALSAVGALQQSKATAAASTFNAQQADKAAKAERDAAAAEAEDKRRNLMNQRASSIAARGASGVALAGTPLMVDENVLGAIELDVARVGQRGEARAVQYENQAKLDRATARNAKRAGPLAAGASLLGGIANIKF